MPTNPPTPPIVTAPRVVILGADALLAARPATPVQLAHACLAAGYRSVIPATWGDELVARECLARLPEHGPRPAICCACPRVAERVLAPDANLARFAIPLVAPPVATARYLRLLAGAAPLHLTFIGSCPSGADPMLDAQLAPAAFLADLARRGIDLATQPVAFDSIIPPDRRRHASQPGGLPAPEALWQHEGARRLVEVLGDDYATELAEHLLAGEPVLLDLAPRLGCACSGAAEGVAPRSARLLVTSLEPPRAPSPVIDPQVPVPFDAPWTAPAASVAPAPATPVWGTPTPAEAGPTPATSGAHPAVGRPSGSQPAVRRPSGAQAAIDRPSGAVRPPSLTPAAGRRTPVALSRVTLGPFPQLRATDGRRLPRAYVAHRPSRPRLRVVTPPAAPATAACPTPTPVPPSVAVATPPPGEAYHAFVAGVAAVVSRQVEQWRVRLDEAIAHWQAAGYRTAVLERARALSIPPDVDGLLATYAAAVDHLRRLEQLTTSVYPEMADVPLLRDPEQVEAAEAFVDRLFVDG